MSNIKLVKLTPSNNFVSLEQIAGITFVTNKTYVLQVKGSVQFCEKATEPAESDEGFTWSNTDPFDFIATGDPVYVKALQPFNGTDYASINIAD